MNEREGRSGRREMTAAGILAVVTSGLFAVNNAEVYRDGNMQPLVTVAAVLLSLFVCGWIERLMTRRGAASLSELLPAAVAPVIGLMLSLALVCVPALPIAEYQLILTRYIFLETEYINISLYWLPVLIILVWMGLETIVRTSYLMQWLEFLALLAAALFAAPGYAVYRLYPLLGGSAWQFLWQTLSALFRFLPVTAAMFITAKGVHGPRYAATACKRALIVGGTLTCAIQLCLGLTFPAEMLADMPAPMNHFAMQIRYDHPTVRLDKIILFLWILCGLIAAAFYLYAGALLLCRTFRMRDIRPVAAALSALCVSAVLLLHYTKDILPELAVWIERWGFWALAFPLAVAVLCGALGKRREGAVCQG